MKECANNVLQDTFIMRITEDRLVIKTIMLFSWVSDSFSKRRRSLEDVYSESGHLNKRYGLYECPSCGNLYKWKKSMLAHLRHQCKQPPRFECTYCPVKNYQKGHIIRHLRVHHPNLSPLYYDWKLNNVYRL
ncbi:Longitudinals lacking protein [Temnothorax longispinosus]|uniref:Longitudinals lacking protein n=1 Tax=Temnothorax longispinosus TaxID=300112 RepID=A0A4V3SAX3_9HYME|nr:Longitudinals lacking protein [Temnothorax longispinosus]